MSSMADVAESAWARYEPDRFGDSAARPSTAPHLAGVVSYEPLPDDQYALVSVPSGVFARALWTQENRRKVEQEMLEKNQRKALLEERARTLYNKVQTERMRAKGRDAQAVSACKQSKWLSSQTDRYELMQDIRVSAMTEKHKIDTKVRLAKAASVGKVAAARAAALEKKQAARQEEALRQRFALAEKARRLQDLRDEHAKRYSRKFVPAGTDWANSQVFRYSPAYRPSSASAPMLKGLPPSPGGAGASSAAASAAAVRRARAAPRLRLGSSASAAGLDLA